MQIEQERVNQLASLIADNDITGRHPERSRAQFRIVYGITPENVQDNLQKLFNIVIQARPSTIGEDRYRRLANRFEPQTVLDHNTHSQAFEYLLNLDDVAQKIANEFLRQVVDVMQLREDWLEELHVPLDIHVVSALVKSGCISGVDPQDIEVNKILNANVSARTRTRISYQELQTAMKQAAEKQNLPRIVFDELWLEHRHIVTNLFLREESFLADMLVT